MKRQLLVKTKIVYEKTEFDTAKKLENARKNGYIEMIRNSKGIWYNIHSVDPIFFKQIIPIN